MKRIKICDVTMLQESLYRDKFTLTFKERTEVAKLLDRIGVDIIETEGIGEEKSDVLRLKAIAATVKKAVIAVPVTPDKANIDLAYEALGDAPGKRLVLSLPVSTVSMEYGYRLKSEGMLKLIKENLEYMSSLSCGVEFAALDATRADRDFLYKAVETAIAAGADTVTVYDGSGTMLPGEFGEFVEELIKNVPGLRSVDLGVGCANNITMAAACLIEGAKAGATELKTAAFAIDTAFLNDIARVLFEKKDNLGLECSLDPAECLNIISRIRWMCKTGKSKTSAFDNAVKDAVDERAVTDEAQEDEEVPEIYKIDSYTINTGSVMTSTAHIRLNKNGRMLEEVVMGDGPIDASFLAIERITGFHYELEDFQIKAISEGREALGQALVRLRGNAGLYTGIGRSTDIIGACIIAYVNALNKIAGKESQG